MARRRIGQESFGFGVERQRAGCLDDLSCVIDWSEIDRLLGDVYASAKGEAGWPPLALVKALLLSVWYDLSDVKLAEALDDRASFRRFCGFAMNEVTPERTAFVRFRKELVARNLDARLFDAVLAQLEAKGVVVKTGTLIDATVLPSASKGDDEARWVGHRRKKPVHGYKAHVASDAETDIVRAVAVTTANVHDLNKAEEVLPEDPGDVYADTAYAAHRFEAVIMARGGTPRIVQRGIWSKDPDALERWNAPIRRVRCRIEKIFGTWKRSYGLRSVRYRGLARVTCQVRLTAIAFNLKRANRLLMIEAA
jgi:IS5 family transposase